MSKPLYVTVNELQAIIDQAEDGEISDEQFAQLDALEMEFGDKVDNVCLAIATYQHLHDSCKQEIERLKKLAHCRWTHANRLKQYLRQCMERLGRTKFDAPRNRVVIATNPPKCEVDPEKADPEFVEERVVKKFDSAGAIIRWKTTGQAPAGFTVTQDKRVDIK